MFIDDQWYKCTVRDDVIQKQLAEHKGNGEVSTLDVQILNDRVLRDILGITDVRNDSRVDFVGGSRGLNGLVKRCQQDSVAAFAMNPIRIDDLLSVADAGLNMPPKSTWFEPKPRSGYVVRCFDD